MYSLLIHLITFLFEWVIVFEEGGKKKTVTVAPSDVSFYPISSPENAKIVVLCSDRNQREAVDRHTGGAGKTKRVFSL